MPRRSGTGTAGAVIAARLTEDPTVSVLAIEAGHSDLKQLYSRIPAAFANLYGSASDHDIRTQPEPQCNNRRMQWPRGKMLYVLIDLHSFCRAHH